MISKQAFIDSAIKETTILKHLYGKILPGTLDYKPTEKQRSINELLQYLGHAPITILHGIKNGTIGDFQGGAEMAKQEPPEHFPKHMDELAALIPSIVNGLSDDDLAAQVDLFGRGSQTRTAWLFELFLKNLVGYKMQLFLYIKASGNDTIGTSDLWRGEDAKHS